MAVLFALGAGGCSFIFSEGPPADRERRAYFDCGESVAPPVLDTIATGLFTLSAIGSASRSGDDEPELTPAERKTRTAVAGAFAVLAGASAAFGYAAVAGCRDARRARAMDLRMATWLPPPYGVYPYGTAPPVWPPVPVAPPAPAAPAPPATPGLP